MNPPVSVNDSTISYVADALRARIDDLRRGETHLASAGRALDLGIIPPDDPARTFVRHDIQSAQQHLAELRHSLETVLGTVDPQEEFRSSLLAPQGNAIDGWSVVLGLVALMTGDRFLSGVRLASETVTRILPRGQPISYGVLVTQTSMISGVTPPRTLTERIARIPTGDSHVRIERYGSTTAPRFEVYISGTDMNSPLGSPWGFGSNVSLLTTGSSASLIATRRAMKRAGITSTTPVVLTGHSQGGIVALALARSGNFRVDAVFTAGTPVGIVGDVVGVPVVHLINSTDPVPALGGIVSSSEGTTWIGDTGAEFFDAHHASAYRDLARSIDSVHSSNLSTLEAQLTEKGSGEARWYETSVSN